MILLAYFACIGKRGTGEDFFSLPAGGITTVETAGSLCYEKRKKFTLAGREMMCIHRVAKK